MTAVLPPRGARVLLPILALTVCASLLLLAAPRAEAFIYWTDAGTQSIGRANLDGTDANVSFIAGITDPGAIAVDDTYIYWAHRSGSGIGRARLDGTGVDPDFIPDSGPYVVTGLCVNKEHLFWVTRKANIMDRNNEDWYYDRIYRADVDGTDVQLPWMSINGPRPMTGCAVKGDYLVYTCGLITDWSAVPIYFMYSARGMNHADDDPVDRYQTLWSFFWTAGVAAGDTYFYWLSSHGMFRMEPGLPLYWTVAAPSDLPGADGGLAKQDEYLFWTDDTGSRIGRIKKSGKESQPDFMTAPVTPVGVAADAGKPAQVAALSVKAARRGEIVIVRGRGFGRVRGGAVVRFGRAASGRYLLWSDRRIVVAVPRHAPLGRVALVVHTKYGPSDAVRFTVRP